MHTLARVLVLLALPLLLAVPALAEDDPAPPSAKPDPVIPSYSIEFLMPTDESSPEGWARASGAAPTGAPSVGALTELASSCQLDDDTFYAETAVLSKGSEKVGIAMLDIDKHVWVMRTKLDEQATANGWVVQELGSPARVVVVSGAQAKVAVGPLTEHVLYALSEMAMNRVRGSGGTEAAGREAALEYTEAMRNIAPGSGVANAIRGIVDWIRSRPTRERKEVDRPVEDKALEFFDKALAEGAAYPPKGSVRVFVAGQLGGILLARKQKDVLVRATRALEIAVEHEQDGKDNLRRFGHRYDLACAYVRAGRIDDAFKMLEKAIETGKTLPPDNWRNSFQHMEEKDPDMGPLRSDPRFSKLMADNRPPPPKNPHGKMPPDHPKPDEPQPKDGR